MITKTEQERQELFKRIHEIANELRNQVDGWDFKAYTLGILFYRYISQDFINFVNKKENKLHFNYLNLEDKKINDEIKNVLISSKGYFIYPSQLFQNVAKLDFNQIENLNEILTKTFREIENSADGTKYQNNFKGLFQDLDLNSNKLGRNTLDRNTKILKIIKEFNNLDFGDFNENSIDIFGDAYEYLIRMYASAAGKSGGEYYTPQEVSELLFKLALGNKKTVNKIYDPACGSGSLLLKACKILGHKNVKHGFYGQEINLTTYNLCRINMFLHGVNFTKFNIVYDDTLLHPGHIDLKFDLIVSNPPYSKRWIGKDNPLLITDERYAPAGVLAPKKPADFAFIMHIIYQLANDGRAAVLCFPGVLYRKSPKAEWKIRKYLVENNFIEAIIQLPTDLFYGTDIATVIIILNKSKNNNKIFFVNASNEFVKVTNANKLSDNNINKIFDYCSNLKEEKYFSKLVDISLIVNNDYDLNVNRYVKQEIKKKEFDIISLNKNIKEKVSLVNSLRVEIEQIIKELEDETN